MLINKWYSSHNYKDGFRVYRLNRENPRQTLEILLEIKRRKFVAAWIDLIGNGENTDVAWIRFTKPTKQFLVACLCAESLLHNNPQTKNEHFSSKRTDKI